MSNIVVLAPRFLGTLVVWYSYTFLLRIKFTNPSTGKPENTFDDKPALLQVIIRYHQAASHYLCQRWPSYILPYDTTRPRLHYIDVIMTMTASQITSLTVVCLLNRLFRCWSKKTSKRWIPRTKGQLGGKCFHLMTSSWAKWFYNIILLLRIIVETLYCNNYRKTEMWYQW